MITREQCNELDKRVARFVILGNHEFDIVEEQEFRDLMQYAVPGWKPMGRKLISDRLVIEMFEEQKLRVKQVMLILL